MQMDYLEYVKEAIDLEGKGFSTTHGLKVFLTEVHIRFLAPHNDDVNSIANSTACWGSKKKVPQEICALLQRAIARSAPLCFEFLMTKAHALVRSMLEVAKILQLPPKIPQICIIWIVE